MDFSQNCETKYHKEEQSTHYSRRKPQITLHTGMLYSLNYSKGFIAVSESLKHDAYTVVANVSHVLNHFLPQLTRVKIKHFISDGQVTKYRNRFLFYLITQQIRKTFKQIEEISYNYKEAGY